MKVKWKLSQLTQHRTIIVIPDFISFVASSEILTRKCAMGTSLKAQCEASALQARQIRQSKDKINWFGLSCLSRLIQCSSGYSSLLVLSLLHLLNNECFSPVSSSHHEYNDALANGSNGILSFIIAGCQVRLMNPDVARFYFVLVRKLPSGGL